MKIRSSYILIALLVPCAVVLGVILRLHQTSDRHQSGHYEGRTNRAEWTVDVTQDALLVDVVGQESSVRLQAINGKQRDILTRLLHPDLGRYAVSMRIIDSQGIPWIMGMDDIPESWQEDYQRSLQVDVNPERRAASSALLVDAKVALDSIPAMNFHALDLLREYPRQE
jgi:hypothetical protein